jgi:preprotein translocase subunit SecD
VLQAANPSAAHQVRPFSPQARYYVLKDDVALSGSDITNPRASTDQGGNPDVQFGFDSAGAAAFDNVTRQIAHRGQDLSTLGQTLDQHFAIALDGQLLTVPSIDYKVYPDGITGGNGADITGGLTARSARRVASILRREPLPVRLAVR